MKKKSSHHDFFSSKLPWRSGVKRKGLTWKTRLRRRPDSLDSPRMFQWGSISTSYQSNRDE